MSTRERWIVYPILFMTLGIALRDKVVPPQLRPLSVKSPEIRCDQLEADRIRCRRVTIVGEDDQILAELGAREAGGFVTLVDPRRRVEVFLGHDGEGLALRGEFRELGRVTTLTVPCRWRNVLQKMALEK